MVVKNQKLEKQITISHVEFHQKEFYPSPKANSLYSFTFHLKSENEKYIINRYVMLNGQRKKISRQSHCKTIDY